MGRAHQPFDAERIKALVSQFPDTPLPALASERDALLKDPTPWKARRLANLLYYAGLNHKLVRELDAIATAGGIALPEGARAYMPEASAADPDAILTRPPSLLRRWVQRLAAKE